MRSSSSLVATSLLAATSASAAALNTNTIANTKRAINPSVKAATVIGNLEDAYINRDSCGSAKFSGRLLWTCRDSQPYDSNGLPTEPVYSSSASWSDPADGTPSLRMYGDNHMTPFFPYQEDECPGNVAGECGDGTRFALWPDSPPMVVSGADGGAATAYTYLRKSQIRGDLSEVEPNPATTLYKVTYGGGNSDDLPSVSVVEEEFWSAGSVSFGSYGNIVHDGTAYLFGKPTTGNIFLARVAAGSVEDKSQYEYWVGGSSWSKTAPSIDDSSSSIPNGSAGGQGTYYYSDAWQSFVWIGQPGLSVSADFMITTAPELTGPWEEPVKFYSGENGSYDLGAYTLQAHPAMSDSGSKEIYVSYTKNDLVQDKNVYTTPLIHIEWN